MTVGERGGPLRILVLSCYPPGGGGGELQTRLQVRELARRGHDVVVIDQRPRHDGPSAERDDGVTVIRIRTPRIPIIRTLVFHAKIATHVFRRGRGSDVAHVNHIGTALLSAAPLLRALRIPRILVIWGSAQPGVGPFGPGWRDRWACRVGRGLERVVSLATVTTGYLQQQGFARDRIVFIPNGVDTERFRPRRRDEDLPSPESWPKSGPIAISAGRLVGAKAYDVLIDAWASVVRVHPAATLVIAGDGPLRGELSARAAALGLAERVILLGNRADLPELLRAADLYVSSSRTEGMSNAILEALGAGLPVVATAVGAAADIVDEGRTGLLVPPEDTAALAGAIDRLLGQASLRRAMGAAARERVLTDFSIDAVVERYVSLYRGLAALR